MDLSHLVHAAASLDRRVLRAPAVHFAAIGALAFWAVSSRSAETPGRARIEIPESRVASVSRELQQMTDGVPTAETRAAAERLVVDREILYRHALSLGLDKGAAVQNRLAQVATFVAENPHQPMDAAERAAQAVELGLRDNDLVTRRILIDGTRRLIRAAILIREPSDAALAKYLDEHPEEFERPAEMRLSHVMLRGSSGEARALALLDRLRADAVPPEAADEYGDPSHISANLPAFSDRELERRFGATFTRQLAGLSEGSWQGPIASVRGWHLVFIQERRPPHVPDLEDVRKELTARVRNQLADRWLSVRLAQLRGEYEVVVVEGS